MKYFCEKCESEDVSTTHEATWPKEERRSIADFLGFTGMSIQTTQTQYKDRATCNNCGNFKETIT